MEEKKLEKISKIFGNVSNLKIILFLLKEKTNFYRLKKECLNCPPSLVNSLKILKKFKIIEYKKEGGKKFIALTERGRKIAKIIKNMDFI
ncbi:MAG: hypothetical protein QXW01_02790 [Candidatus Aenigmatarchaeota archaeon]